ncbi:MAG TPA: hypothetical protein VFG90_04345 [Nitrososphaeraceae archaeon]|nr:hypothetical protein [Nitrososphaeraceae archaeon]
MSQKPTIFIKNPKRFWLQTKTEEEKVLSWLEEKYHNADPDKKQRFENKVEASSTPTTTEAQEYFIDENSKEFGLRRL